MGAYVSRTKVSDTQTTSFYISMWYQKRHSGKRQKVYIFLKYVSTEKRSIKLIKTSAKCIYIHSHTLPT